MVRPEITRDGVVVASPGVPEDPLVGPLRAADFVHLGPGEVFDPTARRGAANFLPLITFTTFSPAEAGLYVCTLEYSSESPTPEDWLGRFNQDDERDAVLKLLADVPRVTVQAEPLHAVVH